MRGRGGERDNSKNVDLNGWWDTIIHRTTKVNHSLHSEPSRYVWQPDFVPHTGNDMKPKASYSPSSAVNFDHNQVHSVPS